MSGTDILMLIGSLAAALASGFFAAAETALTAFSDTLVYRLKQEGHPKVERIERLRQDLSGTLGALLIGNAAANTAAGALATAVSIRNLGEKWGVLAATVGTTLLLLIFAEVTPKTLAARRAEDLGLLFAGPIELVVKVLRPVTRMLSAIAHVALKPLGASEAAAPDVTEADVKSLIQLSHEHGSLESEEKDILHAVIEFGDLTVADALVPRARVVSLPAEASFDEVEEVCREHRYSRYPVFRGSPDEIIGILHVKDLFDVSDAEERTFEVARYLRPAVFVPELKRAGDLFREMRRRRFHMAIVVDELGVIAGLVTLEDLIERILGAIEDEHDEPVRRPVSDGTSLILEGTYPLASLERELGTRFEEPEAETVAGLLLRRFGRIPRPGARVSENGLEFVVERASPRAIERIRISKRKAS